MYNQEFIKKLDETFSIITERKHNLELMYQAKGYDNFVISFEEIDLEDLLESRLVPLFLPILESYPYPFSQKKQMSVVFVAFLCEIAKRGFTQGGILKTIEQYIGGDFDRNKYYRILPDILKEENIEVTSRTGKKYENAIITEAGIPQNLHGMVMSIFKIYWKWFKYITPQKRHFELEHFIYDGQFTDLYILDEKDFTTLKREINDNGFDAIAQKTLKVCLKLEEVFCEIDKFEEIVSEENINELCDSISKILGYNILTIVNERELKSEVVAYANRVSFNKFEKLLNKIFDTELIEIPTGEKVLKGNHKKHNYICGIYVVKGIKYEVSYPIALTLDDLLLLQRDKIHLINDYHIYISSEPFVVEIDGWEQELRQIVHKKNTLYIYAAKISSGVIAYINDEPVNLINNHNLVCGYRKYWDQEKNESCLCIYLNEFSLYDPKYKMKRVDINVDGKNVFTKVINSHGYVSIRDHIFSIDGYKNKVSVKVSINEEMLVEKEILLPDIGVFGKYNGIRIDGKIDLAKWYGDSSIVIFSLAEIIEYQNIHLRKSHDFGNYKVYEGNIDFHKEHFMIGEKQYSIVHSENPYICISSDYEFINDKLCVSSYESVKFKISGNQEYENVLILKIEHDGVSCTKTIYNKNIEIDLNDIFKIPKNYSGKWEAMLICEQTVISKISYIILPQINIINQTGFTMRTSKCQYELISDCECFFNNGEYTNKKSISIDTYDFTFDNVNFTNTIKECVYIDKCDVYKHFLFPVKLWDMRVKENHNMQEISSSIDYNQLESYTVYIEANTSETLHIKVNESSQNIIVKRGENRIQINNFLNECRSVNELVVYDDKNNQRQLKILYRPNIYLLKRQYINDSEFIFYLKYNGPVGMKLGIELFEEYKRISRKEINMLENDSIFSVRIEHKKNISRTLSVEVDFNGRGKKSIGELFISKQESIIEKEIVLQTCSELHNLLNLSAEEKIQLTTNLFEILHIRGDQL